MATLPRAGVANGGFRNLTTLFLLCNTFLEMPGLLDSLPALRVLGVVDADRKDHSTDSMQALPWIRKRPDLRLLYETGKTLWFDAVQYNKGTNRLERARAEFPGNSSFDINASNYFDSGTALSASLMGYGYRIAELGFRLGVDLAKRFLYQPPRFSSATEWITHPNRPISPFLAAILQKDAKTARILWPSYLRSIRSLPVQELVDLEPIHPIIAACFCEEVEFLENLLGWSSRWGWFLPADHPVPPQSSLNSRAPLLVSLLQLATGPVLKLLLETVAQREAEGISNIINSPCNGPHGGTWLHFLTEKLWRDKVESILQAIPDLDTEAKNDAGLLPIHLFLQRCEFVDSFPASFKPKVDTYLEALEYPSGDSVYGIAAMRRLLQQRPLKNAEEFLSELETRLLSLSESGEALQSFLKERYQRIHPTLFGRLCRSLTELQATDLSKFILTNAVQATPRFPLVAEMLLSLKSYTPWVGSEDFVVFLWTNWSVSTFSETPAIFDVLPPRVVPANPEIHIPLGTVAKALPKERRVKILRALLEEDPQNDGTFEEAFFATFPPSSSHRTPSEVTRDETLVFTQLIAAVTLSSAMDLSRYLELGVRLSVPTATLRPLLERPEAAHFGDQLWAICLCESQLREAYHLKFCDLMIELNIRARKDIYLQPMNSPSLLIKFISFHRKWFALEAKLTNFWSALLTYHNLSLSSPAAGGHLQTFLAINWALAKPSRRDPFQLLWREILRLRVLGSEEYHFAPEGARMLFRQFDDLDVHCNEKKKRLFATFVHNGYFESIEADDLPQKQSACWKRIARKSRSIAAVLGLSEFDIDDDLFQDEPYPVVMSFAEAIGGGEFSLPDPAMLPASVFYDNVV